MPPRTEQQAALIWSNDDDRSLAGLQGLCTAADKDGYMVVSQLKIEDRRRACPLYEAAVCHT